jgi:hypothetical protein
MGSLTNMISGTKLVIQVWNNIFMVEKEKAQEHMSNKTSCIYPHQGKLHSSQCLNLIEAF